MRLKFNTPEKILIHEIEQKEEEGYDVSSIKSKVLASTKNSWEELRDIDSEIDLGVSEEDIEGLYQELHSPEGSSEYEEPSDLDSIFEKSSPQEQVTLDLDRKTMLDKLKGAWEGRSAGCLLGKPVEGWGGVKGKERIEKYLKEAGEYPLQDYFPIVESEEYEIHHASAGALRENIDHMIRDDDLDYPILNLNIVESFGDDFTSKDIADFWLNNLPYTRTYTAERVAYHNFVNGIYPPESGLQSNPYREWIGAQIRADLFGWINPGRPKRAAEMAYRDAIISHRKNGIYGELFVAAMIAAAGAISTASSESIEELIEIGLSVVPEGSRFYEAVEQTSLWAKEDGGWKETFDKVMEEFGGYHWVHTINNAAIIVLALVQGEGDFEDSITTAVMCGHDTDCTGATVGSILGMLKGSSELSDKWIAPLNNKVDSIVIGDTENKLTDLAKRAFEIMKY